MRCTIAGVKRSRRSLASSKRSPPLQYVRTRKVRPGISSKALRCTTDGCETLFRISISRARLCLIRSSSAPPEGPCSQILTATSFEGSIRASSGASLRFFSLVASKTLLNVPCPSCRIDLHVLFRPCGPELRLKYSTPACSEIGSSSSTSSSATLALLGGGDGSACAGSEFVVSPRWVARYSSLCMDGSWFLSPKVATLGRVLCSVSGTNSLILLFLPCACLSFCNVFCA